MAVTLAEIILLGVLVDWVFRKMHIPGLVGMLLLGVVLGPAVLGLMSPEMAAISADLRLIALIVILLRAGFELSRKALARVGRMALLLSFVPATLEAATVTALGPRFLGLTYLESAMLGTVLGAVSPAVVVPLMLKLIEERRGVKKGIPTLLLAASSIDDVFVIVIYSVLCGFYVGRSPNLAWKIAGIPLSIIVGIGVGILIGMLLYRLFLRFNPRATKRVLVILGISVLLVRIEHLTEDVVPFASLLAVMAIGYIILEKQERMAHEISAKLAKIWVFAEILLFTLVGAQVDVRVAVEAGLAGSAVILLALAARSIGAYLCCLGSDLTVKERLFVVVAYIPKATVQAAIGGTALMMMKNAGMPTAPGEIILATAVLSIVLTAPTGAWAISYCGEKWLPVDKNK
ncbi:MAG TPA: cation:proton antiporter [bacterium]|nr:cation:proton antiporter [bacterium]